MKNRNMWAMRAWHDLDYQDGLITRVLTEEFGYSITTSNHWSLFLALHQCSPLIPLVGQNIRVWTKGLGYPWRGVAIEGNLISWVSQEERDE